MSYTPPSGNAAELRFSSRPYTPPGGDAADLTFGESGVGEGQFAFSGTAEGAHGVVSEAVGAIHLLGDNLGEQPPCAIAFYNLSLFGSGEGSHPNFAFASATFTLSGSASGISSRNAETFNGLNQLLLVGEAYGGLPQIIEGYGAFVLDGTASAAVQDSYQGAGVGTMLLSGTSLGFYNTSSASGSMPLLGLGSGERGVVCSAAGVVLINGDGASFTGAPSTGAGELSMQGGGEVSHGRAVSASGLLLIFGSSDAAVGMAGSATGLLEIFGAGGAGVTSAFSADGAGALRFFCEATSPSVDVSVDTLHIFKPSDNRIVVQQ